MGTGSYALIMGLVMLTVSGCLSTKPGDSSHDSESSKLLDFANCTFKYPDGRPVPCENLAKPVAVEGSAAPTGWVCQGSIRTSEYRFALLWSPLEDRYAISFDYPSFPQPSSGLLQLESKNGERRLYGWTNSGPSGVVLLPMEVKEGDGARLNLYNIRLETTTDELKNASAQAFWSLYMGEDWALFEVSSSLHKYYFTTMTQVRNYVYEPSSEHFQGADFELDVNFIDSDWFAFSVGTFAPDPSDPFC